MLDPELAGVPRHGLAVRCERHHELIVRSAQRVDVEIAILKLDAQPHADDGAALSEEEVPEVRAPLRLEDEGLRVRREVPRREGGLRGRRLLRPAALDEALQPQGPAEDLVGEELLGLPEEVAGTQDLGGTSQRDSPPG